MAAAPVALPAPLSFDPPPPPMSMPMPAAMNLPPMSMSMPAATTAASTMSASSLSSLLPPPAPYIAPSSTVSFPMPPPPLGGLPPPPVSGVSGAGEVAIKTQLSTPPLPPLYPPPAAATTFSPAHLASTPLPPADIMAPPPPVPAPVPIDSKAGILPPPPMPPAASSASIPAVAPLAPLPPLLAPPMGAASTTMSPPPPPPPGGVSTGSDTKIPLNTGAVTIPLPPGATGTTPPMGALNSTLPQHHHQHGGAAYNGLHTQLTPPTIPLPYTQSPSGGSGQQQQQQYYGSPGFGATNTMLPPPAMSAGTMGAGAYGYDTSGGYGSAAAMGAMGAYGTDPAVAAAGYSAYGAVGGSAGGAPPPPPPSSTGVDPNNPYGAPAAYGQQQYPSAYPGTNPADPYGADASASMMGGDQSPNKRRRLNPPQSAPIGSNSSRALKAGQRRPRKMFTDAEVLNLVKGVERFGEGKWARILETYKFDDRTSVDLKDKWRNLQKPASTVKVPKDRRLRLKYSKQECENLAAGVQMFGHNWVTILQYFDFLPERTPVDLKDKWRNLQMRSGKIEPPTKQPRKFLLLNSEQHHIFRNVYPRDAALKAAARGYELIKLLQMGTPRIHVFAGERERIDAPSIRKFSARGADGQVWKGRVLKLGMQRATVADLCVAKGRVAAQLGDEAASDIAPYLNGSTAEAAAAVAGGGASGMDVNDPSSAMPAAAGNAMPSNLTPEDPNFWGGGNEDYVASFPGEDDDIDYAAMPPHATQVVEGAMVGMEGMDASGAHAAGMGAEGSAAAVGMYHQQNFKAEADTAAQYHYDAATAAAMMHDGTGASMVPADQAYYATMGASGEMQSSSSNGAPPPPPPGGSLAASSSMNAAAMSTSVDHSAAAAATSSYPSLSSHMASTSSYPAFSPSLGSSLSSSQKAPFVTPLGVTPISGPPPNSQSMTNFSLAASPPPMLASGPGSVSGYGSSFYGQSFPSSQTAATPLCLQPVGIGSPSNSMMPPPPVASM